ncbi:MAG: hypothetical protein ABR538_17035 [Candidatus Binatia bacterium]
MRTPVGALLRHPFRFATLALLLEAAVAVGGFGWNLDGLQAVTRYSGRVGLLWFALVFSISPLHRLRPREWTRLALRRRRQLGLAFGYHHLVHLALVLSYLQASGRDLDPSRAAGGVLGYVLVVAMMLTSSDAAVATFGAHNWRRLHRAGLWYLWVAFLLTYLPRLQGKVENAGGGMAEFTACISLVLAIALLRGAALLSPRPGAGIPTPG